MKPTVKVISRKARLALQKKGTHVSLDPTDPKFEPQRIKAREILSPSSSSALNEDIPEALSAKERHIPQTVDGMLNPQTADRMPPQTADRMPPQTADRMLRQTADGMRYVDQNKPDITHTADPLLQSREPILLSPNQWQVFNTLRGIEEQGRITSYRDIAAVSGVNFHSVRDAIRILERVGAILEKRVVKSSREQGFYVSLSRDLTFIQASVAKLKSVKRGGNNKPQTVGGMRDVPARMSVCKRNTYIQGEDVKELLGIPPQSWQIREATVIEIADMFPTMNATVFRLSVRQAVEQAQAGKKEIQNPNAWLKAAFEQNGAPLVTERDIEARLAGNAAQTAAERPTVAGQGDDADMETLQRYMAATEGERAEIDLAAAEKAKPALARVGEDKHAGVMLQARIEAAREYFATQS